MTAESAYDPGGHELENPKQNHRKLAWQLGYLCILISFSVLLWAGSSWSDHKVGEPQLEKLDLWYQCCHDRDCVSQPVRIMGPAGANEVGVEIEDKFTWVRKDKLYPVPSSHTWVCYQDLNGEILDENIRCVLYPQNKGSVQIPEANPRQG